MATMHFCGATGKMFRGHVTEWTAWEKCAESECPESENCFPCILYLQASRRHNNEPYRCGRLIVAGKPALNKKRLRENRLRCGEIARQQRRE